MTEGALLSRVRETIRRHRMLSPGDTVIVSVSGSPDSVALLHLLVALRGELRLSPHVAHFNHSLRPDAAEDAAFVATLSGELALSYHEGAGDTRTHADRLGLSVEDAARRLRYEFLVGVARATAAQAAATGHTRDDQAGTVLMRILRGGGLRGLAGIPPVRPLDGARLVRPLIETPRADIAAYLGARGLAFREDPINRGEIPTSRQAWLAFPRTCTPGDHSQATRVYTGLEGHRRSSPSPPEGVVSNGKETSSDPPPVDTHL